MSFYLCVYGQIYVYAFAYTGVCERDQGKDVDTEILVDNMKCMNDEKTYQKICNFLHVQNLSRDSNHFFHENIRNKEIFPIYKKSN